METVPFNYEKNLGNRETGKDWKKHTAQKYDYKQRKVVGECHLVERTIQTAKLGAKDLSTRDSLKASSMSSPPHPNGSAFEPTTPNKVEERKISLTRGGMSNVETVRLSSKCGPKSCLQCASTKTPLWRNGPLGAKTLCNACGIRYNKMKAGKKCRTPFNETGPLATTSVTQNKKSEEKLSRPHSTTKKGLWPVNRRSASIPTRKRTKVVGRRVAEVETSGSSHDVNHDERSDEGLSSRRSSLSEIIRNNISRAEVLKQHSGTPDLVEAADLLMALCYGPNWMQVV